MAFVDVIPREKVYKLISLIDAGLCRYSGNGIPGQMCVEIAICKTFEGFISDQPVCVDSILRYISISLNDLPWSSKKARALAFKKFAILQLGTSDPENFNVSDFYKRYLEAIIRKIIPFLIQEEKVTLVDKTEKFDFLEEMARRCEFGDLGEVIKFGISSKTFYEFSKLRKIFVVADTSVKEGYSESYSTSLISALLFKLCENNNIDFQASFVIDTVCNILIDMKVPAVKYLDILDS